MLFSPDEQASLSTKQRETLLMAYRRDYFKVPRQTILTGIAATDKISGSAPSQRIRRGTEGLIEQTLLADDEPELHPEILRSQLIGKNIPFDSEGKYLPS